MAEVVWRGRDFSMRPVDPATAGDNPVTMVLNMVLKGDMQVRKRDAASAASTLPANTVNSIIFNICGTDWIAVKTAGAGAGSIKVSSNGTSWTALSNGGFGSDYPLGTISPSLPGSFSFASGELYYCDEDFICAWDGNTDYNWRRPGVPSLDGEDYLTMGLAEAGGAQATYPDGYAAFGPPFGAADDHPGGADGDPPWDTSWSPRIAYPSGVAGSLCGLSPEEIGSKILNTSFSLSWYDAKRRIYGRRSQPFALPYLFAGGVKPGDSALPDILSSARVQYAKLLQMPDPGDSSLKNTGRTLGYSRDDLQVAVWFTRGFLPAANTSGVVGGGWWVFALYTPAMSTWMNALMFLEGIYPPTTGDTGYDEVACGKDDTSLYASGRYLDQYARPLPSKFMTILPNGVAVYFHPRAVPNRQEELALDMGGDPTDYPLGNYAEYSVGHPEQIGRNTNEQRDTVSPIAGLRGQIIRAIPEGTSNLLLTTAGVYRAGFQRSLVVAPTSPTLGVAAEGSIVESSVGTFWFSHEGVVWLRGGKTVFLDEQLGFGLWFDELTAQEQAKVGIANVESRSQIIVTVPRAGNKKALCYDYGRNFASKFTGSDMEFTTSVYFQGKVYASTGNYPEGSNPGVATQVEMWISEEVNRVKQLKWVEISVGPGTGPDLTVTVEARKHPNQRPDYAGSDASITRTTTISTDTSTGRKYLFEDFLNMRGRVFRIAIDGPVTADWGLQEVRAEYEYVEGEDARSA